jgi:hypothetical protein
LSVEYFKINHLTNEQKKKLLYLESGDKLNNYLESI